MNDTNAVQFLELDGMHRKPVPRRGLLKRPEVRGQRSEDCNDMAAMWPT